MRPLTCALRENTAPTHQAATIAWTATRAAKTGAVVQDYWLAPIGTSLRFLPTGAWGEPVRFFVSNSGDYAPLSNPCSMSGYTAIEAGGCQDVDECASDPCTETGVVCENNPGSYECVKCDEVSKGAAAPRLRPAGQFHMSPTQPRYRC